MESQHRGPLVGFVAVAVISGFLVGHALRTQTPLPASSPTGQATAGATPGESPSGGVAGEGISGGVGDPSDSPTTVVVKSVGEAPVLTPADGSSGAGAVDNEPGTTPGDPDGDGVQARGEDGKGPAGGKDPQGGKDPVKGDGSGNDDDDADEDGDGPGGKPEKPGGKPSQPPTPPNGDKGDKGDPGGQGGQGDENDDTGEDHAGDRPLVDPPAEAPEAAADSRGGEGRP